MFPNGRGKFQVNVGFQLHVKSGSIFEMDGRKAKLGEFIFADFRDAVERRNY